MKRTIKSLLTSAGLAFIGLGSLLIPQSAEAAYVAPFVPTGCMLYTKSGGFPYPYTPGAGEFVYCGANPTTYRTAAGDVFMNLPNSNPSSFLRDKFQAANVTLYVFTTPQAAQAALNANGIKNVPDSVLGAGILGVTQTSAVAPLKTQAFVAVWENYLDPISGKMTPVQTTIDQRDNTPDRYTGGVSHESGHITDWLAGTATNQSYFVNSYNADANAFNAVPHCTQYPYPYPGVTFRLGPVCNSTNTQVQPNYTAKSNVDILVLINPGYDRYFANLVVAGGQGAPNQEIFAEQVPIVQSGNHGGISGTLDDWIVRFGTCTLKYTREIYTLWQTAKPAGCP